MRSEVQVPLQPDGLAASLYIDVGCQVEHPPGRRGEHKVGRAIRDDAVGVPECWVQVVDNLGDTVEIGVVVGFKGDAEAEVPVAIAVECTVAVRAVNQMNSRAVNQMNSRSGIGRSLGQFGQRRWHFKTGLRAWLGFSPSRSLRGRGAELYP